jgi:hypothetical protein
MSYRRCATLQFFGSFRHLLISKGLLKIKIMLIINFLYGVVLSVVLKFCNQKKYIFSRNTTIYFIIQNQIHVSANI